MIYKLIPANLHSEIVVLLPVWLRLITHRNEKHKEELRRNGFIVAYDATIPNAEGFAREIETMSVLGLNQWGFPCNPESSQCESQHRLFAGNRIRYIAQILRQVEQNGIAEELEQQPEIEVPDRFTFGSGKHRYEVEDWTQEAAEVKIKNSPWIRDGQLLSWSGTQPGYGIGSTTTLADEIPYEEDEASEFNLFDSQALMEAFEIHGETDIQIPAHLLSLEALLQLDRQCEVLSATSVLFNYQLMDGKIIQSEKVTRTVPEDEEIPF